MNDTSDFVTNTTFPRVPRTMLSVLPIAISCCVSIGIPLNLLIVTVIIAQRRLHKPRHIFWLGVTFSNLFALITSLVELTVFYLIPGDEVMCWVFISIVGIPYATLLLNLLLGLLDRYVAITYPLWHKNKVTTEKVIIAQLIGLIFLSFFFKLPYIIDGNLNDLNCEEHQPHGKVIVLTLLSLMMLCILLQIVIYFRARKHFYNHRGGQCRHGSASSLNASTVAVRNARLSGEEETSLNAPQTVIRHGSGTTFFVHVGSDTISRLEIEAAWTLLAGVSSLCLFASPIFFVLLCAFYCGHIYEDCRSVTWMIPYFRELVLVHTIYNPIIYVWRSREFTSALARKCCRGGTVHRA